MARIATETPSQKQVTLWYISYGGLAVHMAGKFYKGLPRGHPADLADLVQEAYLALLVAGPRLEEYRSDKEKSTYVARVIGTTLGLYLKTQRSHSRSQPVLRQIAAMLSEEDVFNASEGIVYDRDSILQAMAAPNVTKEDLLALIQCYLLPGSDGVKDRDSARCLRRIKANLRSAQRQRVDG
jgi:hypothetical protein